MTVLYFRSSNCSTHTDLIYRTVCECKHRKILETVQRLDEIKGKSNNTLVDLMRVLNEDIQTYLNVVSNCYKANGREGPNFVELIQEVNDRPMNNASIEEKVSATNSTASKKETNNTALVGKSNSTQKKEIAVASDHGKQKKETKLENEKKTAQTDIRHSNTVDTSVINEIRDYFASRAYNREECEPCVH